VGDFVERKIKGAMFDSEFFANLWGYRADQPAGFCFEDDA